MSNLHVKYLLVGGGLASFSAAAAIRALDPEGNILLVAQEIVRPYHRPPLSKAYLRREVGRDELFASHDHWFERNRVDLRTGRRAAHLDVARGAVALDNGDIIGYDKLLLATGMSPRPLNIPGADLPNLLYLRTLEDAHRLHKAIDKAKAEGRPHEAGSRIGPRGSATVIGGGFLGVELSASLAQAGLRVDLLHSHAHPLNRVAGEIAGKALATFLEKRGVRVHLDSRVVRVEGDGRAQRVVCDGGAVVDCDLAIAAVGGVAHRELLRGTPIAAENAILVDSHCRTNVPQIFAAGDCAAVFDPLFGTHRLLDHWENASITGRLAGRNMAGAAEPYATVNHFYSEAFDLRIDGWGEARQVVRRLVRDYRTANGIDATLDLVEIGIAADGRVAQVLALGHAADGESLRELVANRVNVNGREERFKDPAIPLSSLI